MGGTTTGRVGSRYRVQTVFLCHGRWTAACPSR